MQRAFLSLTLLIGGCQKAPPVAAASEDIAATAPAEAPVVPETVDTELLLWEVEKDGVKNHLFGTCHLPIPLDYALPPAHQPALSNARVVVTELDMSHLDPLQIMGQIWDPNYSLSESLGQEAWRALLFRSRPTMPATMLEHMPPWITMVITGLQPTAAPRGSHIPALDAAIQAEALTHGATGMALETFEEQIAVMTGFNDEILVQLREASQGETTEEQDLEKEAIDLACLYGDTGALEGLLKNPVHAESMGRLLDVRNDNWMPKIEAQFTDGDVFVAVGAAHMFGERGLIRQLEDKGYQITRQRGQRSGEAPWVPGPSPFKGIAPQVGPVNEAALENWSFVLTKMLTPAVCADTNPMRACLIPTQSACEERLETAVPLCVTQWADKLPQGDALIEDTVQAQIAGCVSADLMIGAITGSGISEAPECAPIRDAMKQAGG